MISPNPQVAYVCSSIVSDEHPSAHRGFRAPKSERVTPMRTVLRKPPLLFAVCLAIAASSAIDTATAQSKPNPSQPETAQAEAADQNTPDTPDEELEAAAVTLDI